MVGKVVRTMTSKRMMEIVSSVFFGTGEMIEIDDRREAFAKLKKEMALLVKGGDRDAGFKA